MKGLEIRKRFLSYFQARDHLVVPSSPLPLEGDPTLLFTAAGMVPFKSYFLGIEKAPHPRVTSSQRCLRTVDIDQVGKTPRHCTYFEMLGNFSFGDYFKGRAIDLAMGFLTEELGLSPQDLWVTVHEDDEESAHLWLEERGFPESRFERLGQDNFWKMGPTGPCGPCSEIFFDFGTKGLESEKPSDGGMRFMEIWNLVFMESERQSDGSLVPLPRKSIDTGMGLERITAACQGTSSVFDTDLFEDLRGVVTEKSEKDIPESSRVVMDHMRGAIFAISEGVMPSNIGRGYVLRRMIRRAIRAGRHLGIEGRFLGALVPPALAPYQGEVDAEGLSRVIEGEEDAFMRAMGKGERELERLLSQLDEGEETLSGQAAFSLFDTFGLPFEATEEACGARGLLVDRKGFEEAMVLQRKRSQADRRKGGEGWIKVGKGGKTTYLRDGEEATSTVLRVDKKGDRVRVVVGASPFYREGGGQVGDQGEILSLEGKRLVAVTNTVLDRGEVFHEGKLRGKIEPGEEVRMVVERASSLGCRRAHTATHLLHAALRETYGEGASQKGSLVERDRLRFDIALSQAPTDKEIADLTRRIGGWIGGDDSVETTEMTIDEARASGAIALFGERYGERVRVVKIGGYSMELCGGNHLSSTGAVGGFILTGHAAVAQGVRRFEAVTGEKAQEVTSALFGDFQEMGRRWSVGIEDVPARVQVLETRLREAESALAAIKSTGAGKMANEWVSEGVGVGEIVFVCQEVPSEDLLPLGKAMGGREDSVVALLVSPEGKRVKYLVVATQAAQVLGAKADLLLGLVAPTFGGGGGGNSGLAQGGGGGWKGLEEGRELLRGALREIR
ncbi:alanine--tRNA ligase [bacterium]|nr:alanine--tRNA ligase [bacterium]